MHVSERDFRQECIGLRKLKRYHSFSYRVLC